MFYYFLKEYEDTIYKGFHRKIKDLRRNEIIILIFFVILDIAIVVSLLFRWEMIISILLICLLLIWFLAVTKHYDNEIKNNRNYFAQDHLEKHIQPLIRQLDTHRLYTEGGIDWLIDCCEKEITNHKDHGLTAMVSKLFMGVINPIVTLILGLILKDLTMQDNIWFLAWLIIIFIMGCGMIFIIQPIAKYLLFPERNIITSLEDDLKYIKTQMREVK